MANKELLSSLIKEQLPEFFNENDSSLPTFLEKYYEFLECSELHFTSLKLNEYAIVSEDDESYSFMLEVSEDADDVIILDSFRNVEKDAFVNLEILTGDTSKATAKIMGFQKYGVKAGNSEQLTPHHLFVLPISGNFIIGETITGSVNRTTAIISVLDKKGPLRVARDLEEIADISNTSVEFLELFRREFIPSIPRTSKQDIRKLITIANEIYRGRGSELSYTWLWRSIYNNENLEFFYPKDYVLRLNDSKWVNDKSIIIDKNTSKDATKFANKIITGGVSGATAIVERVVLKESFPNSVYELFISDINGVFERGDVVTSVAIDGVQPEGTVVGVVGSIKINDGGTGYSVGDDITIQGGGGVSASATVGTVTDGAVSDITISDGGDGYVSQEDVEYFNSGTGGSGSSARVKAIQYRGTAKTFSPTIEEFAATQLNISDFAGDLSGFNINTHLHSNSTTTYVAVCNNVNNITKGMFIADAGNTVVATVVDTPAAATIVYTLFRDDIPNFVPGTNPSIITAFYANNDPVPSTSASILSINTTANTVYHGALTLSEISYGTIKDISILTAGSGYRVKPTLAVSQNTITKFNNNDDILGPKSKFINFSSNTQYQFRYGNTIIGETSGAKGVVLDPYIENTSNSTFSTLRYLPSTTTLAIDSTDGSADAGSGVLLEDGYNALHGDYQSTASIEGNFALENTDFISGEVVVQKNSLINAVSALSNTVTIDTALRGNSASLVVGTLSIGSITSVTMKDFGIGYTSAPTVTSTGGDNNAQLTALLGVLSEFSGTYSNEDGQLSGKDKIQDSQYYQDFSYVLKTDIPITTFRDSVKSFIHPAGWALFGEIAFRSTLSVDSLSVHATSGLQLYLSVLDVRASGVESLFETLQIISLLPSFISMPVPGTDDFIVVFKDPGSASVGVTGTSSPSPPIIINPPGVDMKLDVDHLVMEDDGRLLTEDLRFNTYGNRLEMDGFVSNILREIQEQFDISLNASYQDILSEHHIEKHLIRLAQASAISTGFEEHIVYERAVGSFASSLAREIQEQFDISLNASYQDILSEHHIEKHLIRAVQASAISTGFKEHIIKELTVGSLAVSTAHEIQVQYNLIRSAAILNIVSQSSMEDISEEVDIERELINIIAISIATSGFLENFITEHTLLANTINTPRINVEKEIEPISVTPSLTQTHQTSIVVPTGGSGVSTFAAFNCSFAEARKSGDVGGYVIRTSPTLQDFVDTYSNSTLGEIYIQNFWNQNIYTLTGTHYVPENLQAGDEVFLPDVWMVLEDFDMLIESGDNMLLEDGLSTTDEWYTGTSTIHGKLNTESIRFSYETGVFSGSKIPFWQKEEHKYVVESVNTSSFTITGINHDIYLPVDLNDFNTQDFRLKII